MALKICKASQNFQHYFSQAVANKLDTWVSYPTYLDMHPFLTSSILKERYTHKTHTILDSTATDASSVYELYAVVCHLGKIQV